MTLRSLLVVSLFVIANSTTTSLFADKNASECVVLLHGLTRSAASMNELEATLDAAGYAVVNLDYPSRELPIKTLAELVVPAALERCRATGARTLHAVTHSLGGILMRQWLSDNSEPDLNRLVMLAPPNKGSEVVDMYRHVPFIYAWLNGPSGLQLGTDKNSVPRQLGPVTMETAVIAGSRTMNLILSQFLPNPNDGKVSVASTRVDGMCAHLTLPVTHPYIMKNKDVIAETLRYLETGRFASPTAEYPDC